MPFSEIYAIVYASGINVTGGHKWKKRGRQISPMPEKTALLLY